MTDMIDSIRAQGENLLAIDGAVDEAQAKLASLRDRKHPPTTVELELKGLRARIQGDNLAIAVFDEKTGRMVSGYLPENVRPRVTTAADRIRAQAEGFIPASSWEDRR